MDISIYNFDLFLFISTILLFISFVGQAVQKPKLRVSAVGSLVFLSIAAVAEIFYARPVIKILFKKNTIDNLFNAAFYHAIVFACLLVTVFIQTSIEEEEQVELEEVEKKKK
jgi:glucan phosphoethanolaminetransferase (alkaline phosphatase superfamily)